MERISPTGQWVWQPLLCWRSASPLRGQAVAGLIRSIPPFSAESARSFSPSGQDHRTASSYSTHALRPPVPTPAGQGCCYRARRKGDSQMRTSEGEPREICWLNPQYSGLLHNQPDTPAIHIRQAATTSGRWASVAIKMIVANTMLADAAHLALRGTMPRCHCRSSGPKIRCFHNQRCNLGELRAAAQAETIKNMVVGRPGTTTPTSASARLSRASNNKSQRMGALSTTAAVLSSLMSALYESRQNFSTPRRLRPATLAQIAIRSEAEFTIRLSSWPAIGKGSHWPFGVSLAG